MSKEKIYKDNQNGVFDYVDTIKNIITADIWVRAGRGLSRNELLVLFYLYKNDEGCMSELAEYIHSPLNTTTGIVSRLEKNEYIIRQRSNTDKRVVNICLRSKGKRIVDYAIGEFNVYTKRLIKDLTPGELSLFASMLSKVSNILVDDKD